MRPSSHLSQMPRLFQITMLRRNCRLWLASAIILLSLFPLAGQPQKKTPEPSANQDKQRGLSVKGKSGKAEPPAAPTEAPAWSLDPTIGEAHAVIIGVSRYSKLPANQQLLYADQDAIALAQHLKINAGFRSLTLLTNEDATRANIMEALARLRDVSRNSLVVVFFAGHGVVLPAKQQGSEQGFLLPYDTEPDAPDATMVQMEAFNNIVKKIQARSIVLITDACQSGTIGDQASRGGTRRGVALREFKDVEDSVSADYQSTFIFTAATAAQSSLEYDQLKHGVFTHYLLEALRGKADNDNNGIITAGELLQHVRTNVAVHTGNKQTPESNTGFDAAIPLGILSNAGFEEYRKWFQSDPRLLRLLGNFDEALRLNRLTKPDGLSAWTYYRQLFNSPNVTKEITLAKRQELLTKLAASARVLIEEAPKDAAEWEKAADWLDKAQDLLLPDKEKKWKVWYSFCRGMAKFHGESGERAAKEFDSVLTTLEEEKLNDPFIAARLGQFYRSRNNWDDAARAYRLAMNDQAAVEWRAEFADVLLHLNQLAAAETQLRLAVKTNADHLHSLKLLAETLLRQTQPEKLQEALRIATLVHQKAPADIEAEDVYGRVLLQTGQVAPALESLRKVALARLNDDRLRDAALLGLSRAYTLNGDAARAISALQEAAERKAKTVGVYDELAALLEQQGRLPEAIAAAQKAMDNAPAVSLEKARRGTALGAILERAGKFSEAIQAYRNAAENAGADSRWKAALETHALALIYRSGEKRADGRTATTQNYYSQLTLPGGLRAVERLTGIRLDANNEKMALATIFDVSLRASNLHAQLTSFYEEFPEFIKQAERKGGATGQIELPASSLSAPAPAVKDVLKFFGAKDNKGKREIDDKKNWAARKAVLLALGGDPARFERGEAVTLKWKNDTLPLLYNLELWMAMNEAGKAEQKKLTGLSDMMLFFLANERLLKLYVGAANLPEAVSKELLIQRDKKEDDEMATGLYFAAPFLRVAAPGQLHFPGGEKVWQDALKNFAPLGGVSQALFRKEEGGLLYLFAACSAAGEVGDYLAASGHFKKLAAQFQKAALPTVREPFDLIDLLTNLQLEGRDKLRATPAAEMWLGVTPGTDLTPVLMTRMEGSAPGRQMLTAKVLAALKAITAEHPEWSANRKLCDLLAKQIQTGREALVEIALDLELQPAQIERLLEQVAALDAITKPEEKQAATRAHQATFSIARLLLRNGSLNVAARTDLLTKLLALNPQQPGYAFALLATLRQSINSETQLEAQLLAQLAGLPALPFDTTYRRLEAMTKTLSQQKHTRLKDLAAAVSAMTALEQNASDATALQQFKGALANFSLPAPPPPPEKKKKSKEPVVIVPSLRELAASLMTPMTSDKLAEFRRQIAPLVGEALLGVVYAATGSFVREPLKSLPELVHSHDVTLNAWGRTEYDASRNRVSGSVYGIDDALAVLAAQSKEGTANTLSATFTASALSSFSRADARWLTNRGMEYVARSIDLGEEVVALAALRHQRAEAVLNQGWREFLSARRAAQINAFVEQGDVKKAVTALSEAELYALGQRYLEAHRQPQVEANLAGEPGPLGLLARLLQQTPREILCREINQFGFSGRTVTGFSRLHLPTLQPYEWSQSLPSALRGSEQMIDLNLALTRHAHRQGHSPLLTAMLAGAAVSERIGQENQTATGAPLPDGNWQGLLSQLRTEAMTRHLNSVLSGLHQSAGTGVNWKDTTVQLSPNK